jgi:uncharacterized protein involved in cysteine biosynthesis
MNIQTASMMDTMVPTEQEVDVSLGNVPSDIKRMLRMQWKEFVHYLEDAQIGLELDGKVIRCSLIGEAKAA